MINVQDASVSVRTANGSLTGLHPTSLSLAERRIAIIGANGSGKSTLARLLNGLVTPSAGSVTVSSGGDHERWLDTVADGPAVRRRVGFVFTDPAAQLVMPTAIEDVELSLRRSHPRKAERVTAALGALARFGLADLADRSVHTLSGGQKQLLALASVLAAQPATIVADEPTTLLDLRNTRLITELLLGLPQQLITTTHDLEFAERCDRVIVIEEGRVAHDSLTTSNATAIAWYRQRSGE